MDPGERRQQSFLEHLSDSEKRLGARRHSVLDALVMGAIAVIIVGGLTLGVVRLRTLTRIDQPNRFDTAAPVSASVSASPASQAGNDDKTLSRPAPSRVQTGKDQRPDSTPPPGQPGKDERPSIDASKPGKYTLRDSKVEVEINTLSEKDRDAKLEQLKKEGLLTEKEAEELKKQKRTAAAAAKAGVVTALAGAVTVRQPALPEGPLKHNDDVFLQDRIATAAGARVEMLLGGKAHVALRERSTVSITEVPGRSTLALDAGHLTMSLARERMRPGEEIQIQTPNAIVRVRDTRVRVETARPTQSGQSAVTHVDVETGSVVVIPTAGTSRPSTHVSSSQGITITGDTAEPIRGLRY